jgi:hypothetical protein
MPPPYAVQGTEVSLEPAAPFLLCRGVNMDGPSSAPGPLVYHRTLNKKIGAGIVPARAAGNPSDDLVQACRLSPGSHLQNGAGTDEAGEAICILETYVGFIWIRTLAKYYFRVMLFKRPETAGYSGDSDRMTHALILQYVLFDLLHSHYALRKPPLT